MTKSLRVGLLSLCLSAPLFANHVQVVDVNAHVLPPPPSTAHHVIVVNSAQHAKRHHGIAGMFQRLHQWHMRQRASLYRSVSK